MSFIDIVIIIMLLGGLVIGYRKGFMASLGSVAALVVACLACRFLGAGRDIPSNLLIFIVAYVTVRLLANLLRRVIHAIALGPIDRLAGAMFVALEYMVGLSLILNVWLWLRSLAEMPIPAAVTTSRWGCRLVDLLPRIIDAAT